MSSEKENNSVITVIIVTIQVNYILKGLSQTVTQSKLNTKYCKKININEHISKNYDFQFPYY